MCLESNIFIFQGSNIEIYIWFLLMHEVRCFINTQIRITKDEMTSGLGYQKMQIKCIYVVVYSLNNQSGTFESGTHKYVFFVKLKLFCEEQTSL